jgi:hypothetical protein
MAKDGAGYAIIMFQRPADSMNSIIGSANFCAIGSDAYDAFYSVDVSGP